MTTTIGKAVEIVGNAGKREGPEAHLCKWALELDARATTRAAGLMQQLFTFNVTCEAASLELFDRECLRMEQVTGFDFKVAVTYRLTQHMQDDMLGYTGHS